MTKQAHEHDADDGVSQTIHWSPLQDPAPGHTLKTPRASAPPRRSANLQGTTLMGRYQVESVIGEGGMATVYRGRHLTIGKPVAIKVLDSALTMPDARERFLLEAQATSRIHHENVIEITDFGATDDDVVFSVMELLTGETLHTLLAHEPVLSPARAAKIMKQICAALEAAHERGIIHRDLKPENCFRAPRTSNADFIKVLDFGIAKLKRSARNEVTAAPRKTMVGMIVGTPEYMAPEQARAEVCDRRTDVYSAGVILFRMLAGRLPFDKPTAAELLAQQLYDAVPPLLDIDPSIPPGLVGVVERAMSKDPSHRYQTMAQMSDAIDLALENSVISEAIPSASSTPNTKWWALGLAAAVMLVSFAVAMWPGGGEPIDAAASIRSATAAAPVVSDDAPLAESEPEPAPAVVSKPEASVAEGPPAKSVAAEASTAVLEPVADEPIADDPKPPPERGAQHRRPSAGPRKQATKAATTPATPVAKNPDPVDVDPTIGRGKITEVKNPFAD